MDKEDVLVFGWDFAHREYTCADGKLVVCSFRTVKVQSQLGKDQAKSRMPRNGIRLLSGSSPTVVVRGNRLSRDARAVLSGSQTRTYTFPRTVTAVRTHAFRDVETLWSVRFNEGLEELDNGCFWGSGVWRLALPSSVKHMGVYAFNSCKNLERADLRAAGLEELRSGTFGNCEKLRSVLLGDLKSIGNNCFSGSGLEEVSIPKDVRHIEDYTFSSCKRLKRVVFTGDVETVGEQAFAESGLESFEAPATLHRLEKRAFRGCSALRRADFGACEFEVGGWTDFF